MVKLIYTLLLLALHHVAEAQKLYYFLSADSLMGVKDGHGKIIIAPKYSYWINPEEAGSLVKDSVIVLYKGDGYRGMSNSWGDAYNRSGDLLYHPLAFDNGPDFFTEERARCVEGRKAGFVNRSGEIVIRPQWDWVTPFEYGYAFVCNNCTLSYEHDSEHPEIIYPPDADTFYINGKGARMETTGLVQNEKDQKIGDRYLPYPFTYTADEQQLVDRINAIRIISQLYFANHYPKVEGREALLQFEITDRSGGREKLYRIQGYEYHNGHYTTGNELLFDIDHKGEIEHIGYFGEKVPLRQWLRKELRMCKEFFGRNPDAPGKFDIATINKQIQALK